MFGISPARLLSFSLALTAAALPVAARAGNPWEELMGRKPKLWSDPAGRFTIDLPMGWAVETKEGSIISFLKTASDTNIHARVSVEMRTVPPNTRLAHFASRVMEEIEGVARNLKVIDEDKVEISGTSGIRRLFRHQERGHAELTDEVVQVIFLAGERGFVVTLEMPAGARELFWEDFEMMTKGFSASGPGEEIRPAKAGEGRKKVRAGEMINPDVAPY
ncbi:MAG: hypothetical protein U1E65_14205 [Myxococcota bacterium]